MIEYLKGVIREFKRIKWPTKKRTIYFTVGVIFISFFFALYMGVLDFGLLELAKNTFLK